MNIYISHNGSYDYEQELYKPIKESELALKHNFHLPHEPANINVDAIEQLKHTDVLVAEASMPSTGQGIELGEARMSDVPIICFYKSGAKPSGSLRFVTNQIIEYTDIQDMLAKLQSELEQF